MIKDGIDLSKYFLRYNKYGDPQAWKLETDTQVHGMRAIKIIELEEHYGKDANKRFADYNATHFLMTGIGARNFLIKKLHHNNVAGLGALIYLSSKAKFIGLQKSDKVTFTPKLYRLHMSINAICKSCNIGQKQVMNLYKCLRYYGLAIIHYGNIIFSPCLYYSASTPHYDRSIIYYKHLLKQNKYGRQYLNRINIGNKFQH